MSIERLLALLARVQHEPGEDSRLGALAQSVGLSPTHLQRVFQKRLGESPKRFASRVSLTRAAAALVTTSRSVLDVAFECGFESHEGFTRAFRRHFGRAPSAYRNRGLVGGDASSAIAASHRELVHHMAPCIGLYGLRSSRGTKIDDFIRRERMNYTVTRREIAEAPILFSRKRIRRSDIATALAELFPKVFAFAARAGIPIAGRPMCRYVDWSSGGVTLEAGVQIGVQADGEGDILAGTLDPGPVVATMHKGPYDDLDRAHAAIEAFLQQHTLEPGGAPWEVYITDPGEVPNPAEWQTEVVQPVRS